MAHVPSKIMSAGEIRLAKAGLKREVGVHADVIKTNTKAVKMAEAELAKAIKTAKTGLTEAAKAHDAAVKLATKVFEAAKKATDKPNAVAAKLSAKAENALAAMEQATAPAAA